MQNLHESSFNLLLEGGMCTVSASDPHLHLLVIQQNTNSQDINKNKYFVSLKLPLWSLLVRHFVWRDRGKYFQLVKFWVGRLSHFSVLLSQRRNWCVTVNRSFQTHSRFDSKAHSRHCPVDRRVERLQRSSTFTNVIMFELRLWWRMSTQLDGDFAGI